MSLSAPDPALPIDVLHVAPWPDPVLEVTGHDPRSSYVERFWLALLGPSTTLFLRRAAAELDLHPAGFDLNLQDWAHGLGLGMKGGRNSPFLRAVARTGQFHLSQPGVDQVLLLRRKLPALSHHQALRLPPPLRDEHERWHQATRLDPDLAQRRTRARRLALSLLELGEPDEAVEHQLHRWKVHPALAHEALRWAHLRRGSPTGSGGGEATASEPSLSASTSTPGGANPSCVVAPTPPRRPVPPPPVRLAPAATASWRPPVPDGPPPRRATPGDAA